MFVETFDDLTRNDYKVKKDFCTKKLLGIILCLCMILSILPATFVCAAVSEEMTFSYAYDVQRNPAFPQKAGEKVTGGTTPIDFDVNVEGVYKLRIVLQGAANLDRYDSESEWKWETLIDGKYVGAYNDGRKRVEKHATPIGNAGLYE